MSCNGMAFFPTNFMLQTSHDQEDHHQTQSSLNLLIPSSCTPQDFHGVPSFLGKRSMSFSGVDVCGEEGNGGEDELSDDGSQAGEKKRRLSMEQVKTLEKNFELGNKLEPERKMQLARALGLKPRQIAIWFQNRRARWKTKQLEKDYDVLKRQYESIKADNDTLQAQNQKLHAEILALKTREPTESINLNKETEGSSSNRSENSSEIKLDISTGIDSPSLPTSRLFFPSSSTTPIRPTTTQVLFQRPPHDLHTLNKNNNNNNHNHNNNLDQIGKEDQSFSNMFCGIDDQSGFWPWLEQPHFN